MRKDAMNAIETTMPADLAATEVAVREALGTQGFGVVSEIDVSANLKNALGIERPPLKILGACSPMLAHEALELDPSVALLLPCNVVLEPQDEGTRVRIVDPRELIDDPRFQSLVDDAATRLQAAVDALAIRSA
jgi:uncharacterized protein (DUF302 family)